MRKFKVSSPRLLLAFTLTAPMCVSAAQGTPAAAGAAIPATSPTHSVSDLPSARPAMLPYQQRTPVDANAVQWNGSVMTIHANGEDLPGILSEVVRATGLKVTGGVPDERVFGVYGPGPVQQVLADLFSGIYVNLLLVNGTATQPKELILTPRTGGPTPPSPARTIETSDQQPRRNDRPYRGTPPPGLGVAPQQPNGPPPSGGVPAPNAAPDANGQPQSPNGVRTPEQIFEELRKRQAAAQGAAASQ
jgi:hypothetical protein